MKHCRGQFTQAQLDRSRKVYAQGRSKEEDKPAKSSIARTLLTARVFNWEIYTVRTHYSPNRWVLPIHPIGCSPGPAVELVGRTPYLPYVFWSMDT